MPLDRYRTRRDFTRTPEPAPGTVGSSPGPGAPDPTAPGGCGRFVVHMHRARRLHWDLRLEIDGVLASWAIPKGPTLDPEERRFAARTEDHPIEYLDFEGVIPAGEYGAGDSICWDWGTFEPELSWDPGQAVRDGELKMRLRGEKLRGRFTLVRTAGRGGDGRATGDGRSRRSRTDAGGAEDAGSGEGWLLIAKRDPDSVAGWDAGDHPASVRSGLTSAEVAAGMSPRFVRPAPAPLPSLDAPGSLRGVQPTTLAPMLATPGTAPFDDESWLFEPKWDGYRALAIVAGGKVRLVTRNGNDAGRYFPELLGPPAWLMAPDAIVDGEVVAFDEAGRPDFSLLQARVGGGFGRSDPGPRPEARAAGQAAPLLFMAFDLPWCAGRSLAGVALEERKAILRLVLREHPRVRYGGHVERDGVAFFRAAAERGLEGAMAKHRASRYEPGRRSPAWLKLKVRPTQELVVAGHVPGQGSHRDLGALLVGLFDGGTLRSVGRVGSGIDGPMRARLRRDLDALARPTMSFAAPTADLAELARTPEVTWVDPVLVIRAEIGGWTLDGNIRQASFVELARDVDPAAVERQDAVGPAAAQRALAKSGLGSGPTRAPAVPGLASRRGASRESVAPASDPTAPAAVATTLPPAPVVAAPAVVLTASAAELAALEALPAGGGTWNLAGREIRLTNLGRVLAPGSAPDDPPITKRELIRYLVEAAPLLLPHLSGRALNLARYPEGIAGELFWQKDVPKGTPDWVARWREPDPPDRRAHSYVLADEVAALGWLGNQAAVEIHPWTSRIEAPAEPRWALIDIDPGTATTWDEVLVLARLFRRALEHLGVTGVPKTSGKRGLQVFIPIGPGSTFEATRGWIELLSRAVGGAVPDLVSWEWAKERRGGRARLDFTQNWRNRTLVAAYSPRPAPGLPVSAPITWAELDDPELRPDRWTIRTILARVGARGDLFAAALGPDQALPPL